MTPAGATVLFERRPVSISSARILGEQSFTFFSSVAVNGSSFQSFRNSWAALRKAQLHKIRSPSASMSLVFYGSIQDLLGQLANHQLF